MAGHFVERHTCDINCTIDGTTILGFEVKLAILAAHAAKLAPNADCSTFIWTSEAERGS